MAQQAEKLLSERAKKLERIRPQGSGDQRDTYLFQQIEHKTIPDRSILCNHVFDTKTYAKKPGTKCTNGNRCRFEHSLYGWNNVDHRKYENLPHGVPEYITITGWRNIDNFHIEIPFLELYPTKLSKAIAQDQAPPAPFRICFNFLFFNHRCLQWENCTFLHVRRDVIMREFKKVYCPLQSLPTNCTIISSECPYAHNQQSLAVPADFLESTANLNANCKLEFKNGSAFESVEEKDIHLYVLETAGVPENNILCSNPYCVKFGDCSHVHLSPQFWRDHPKTRVKPIFNWVDNSAIRNPQKQIVSVNPWKKPLQTSESNKSESSVIQPELSSPELPPHSTPLTPHPVEGGKEEHMSRREGLLHSLSFLPSPVTFKANGTPSSELLSSLKQLHQGCSSRYGQAIKDFIEGGECWIVPDRNQPKYVTHTSLCLSEQTLQSLAHSNDDEDTIHRDIKPDNILIDRMKQPRIIDFGISTQMLANRFQATVTMSHGTPCYIPPEVMFGKVTRTSDLYSLGRVLEFLLEGKVSYGVQLDFDHCSAISSWPSRVIYAAKDLRDRLCDTDINKRAYYAFCSEYGETPHKFVLSHPFFWNDRRALSFLCTLGNMSQNEMPEVFKLLNPIISSTTNWKSDIATYLKESPNILTCEEPGHESPTFYRFIRNRYIHLRSNQDFYVLLTERPILLDIYPKLVLDSWFALFGNEKARTNFMLRTFFTPYLPTTDIDDDSMNWW